jgi:hypothetical protein
MRTVSLLEHLVYAVGSSLAVGILGGFVLNAVGCLRPTGWATWFLLFVLSASSVAVRRDGASELPHWPRLAGFRLRHVVAFAVAASVATGAYALAVRDEGKQQQFKYTEFWMLPDGSGGLGLGVRSAEVQPQRFDLEISLDGRLLAVFRSLVITPGEVWTRRLPLSVGATPRRAVAKLYRLDDNRIYRQVSALVPGD